MNAPKTYWVYDNWTINKARVHYGNCSYCNEGRGIHSSSSGKNSRWLGPFGAVDEADDVARRQKRAITDRCSVCSPL